MTHAARPGIALLTRLRISPRHPHLVGEIDHRPLAFDQKVDEELKCVGGKLLCGKSMVAADDPVGNRAPIRADEVAQSRHAGHDTEVAADAFASAIIPPVAIHTAPGLGIDRGRRAGP